MIEKAARLSKIRTAAQLFKSRHPQTVGQTVRVVEVGPRDGLQNEKKILSLD